MGTPDPEERKDQAFPRSELPGLGAVKQTDRQKIEIVHGRDGWLSLPHTTAWVDGMVLYSTTIAEHMDGWRAILKATRRGRFYVSFVHGTTWRDALEGVLDWAETGTLQWWEDKYPPK